MSRWDNCHNNAIAKNFFSCSSGSGVSSKHIRPRRPARSDVLHYIEMFYNPRRRISTSGDLSHIEHEWRYTQSLTGV